MLYSFLAIVGMWLLVSVVTHKKEKTYQIDQIYKAIIQALQLQTSEFNRHEFKRASTKLFKVIDSDHDGVSCTDRRVEVCAHKAIWFDRL